MFIALSANTDALQRSAMCLRRSVYIPLLTERNTQEGVRYKHVAPLEQELRTNEDDTSRQTFAPEEQDRRTNEDDLGKQPSKR